jgi:DNA topoisomerase-3
LAKALFITEKPSVAMEFAKALKINGQRKDGYMESDRAVITWCVGHLVTMSYPEEYDINLKKWSLGTLPFLPQDYKYEVIEGVKKQFETVSAQLNRNDIDVIYVCTDSGREGEYIYRLVDEMVGVKDKARKRVWIDSQTEEEIIRGVKTAKDLSEYDNLGSSAYLRAKEDYLIGINFSRLITLTYGNTVSRFLGKKYTVISVGRVMTCVLGMIVIREREIRNFVKTTYYKVSANFTAANEANYDGEWKADNASEYYMSHLLFNETGFKKREDAEKFTEKLKANNPENKALIEEVKKKQEKKFAPLLFNLAELQSECSKKFKLSPDETLKVIQSLYEKKMLTYPRTDARVLSTAVTKEITKNINGVMQFNKKCTSDENIEEIAKKVIENGWYKNMEKTKYVNDSAITDHYAIIPTGQGLENYNRLPELEKSIYVMVVKRFLSIFYPPAIYNKLSITTNINNERFFTSAKVCIDNGYLDIFNNETKNDKSNEDGTTNEKESNMAILSKLRKGQNVTVNDFKIKEAETSPPQKYTSGSIILAMENAGKLIEDEELREQIKSSGIGTSSTRAEILKKLEKIEYIKTAKKTQVLSPTIMGEAIYDVIKNSVGALLNPELTASWEKGLTMVANGEIDTKEYMQKLESYIFSNTKKVMKLNNQNSIVKIFSQIPTN